MGLGKLEATRARRGDGRANTQGTVRGICTNFRSRWSELWLNVSGGRERGTGEPPCLGDRNQMPGR